MNPVIRLLTSRPTPSIYPLARVRQLPIPDTSHNLAVKIQVLDLDPLEFRCTGTERFAGGIFGVLHIRCLAR